MNKYLDIIEKEVVKRARRPVQSHWASKLSRITTCPRCAGKRKIVDPAVLDAEPTAQPSYPLDNPPMVTCPRCEGTGQVLEGACMRATFRRWIGATPSDETETGGALKMLMGSSVHDSLEEILGRAVAALPEHRLSYHPPELRYPIVARGDEIVFVTDEKCVDLVEIKSVDNKQMYYLQPEHEVREDWFLQGCVGAALWNREFPHLPVRNMHFIVIARGNANRYEAVRAATPETVETVLQQCVARCAEAEQWILRAAAGQDVLPPAEYKDEGWTHWLCRISRERKKDGYCPDRTWCHKIEEGDAHADAPVDDGDETAAMVPVG